MSTITLTIVADDADNLVGEFRRINTLTTPANDQPVTTLANAPLDALVDMARQRLREEGFKLEIIDQRDQSPPASPPQTDPASGPQVDPPAAAPKAAKGKGKKVPAETITEPTAALDEDPTAPPSKGAPVQDPDASDPETDRQFVMDTLGGLAQSAKLKAKVFAFAGRLAKKFGKDKLGDLPSEPFPEIRAAMEMEFADVIPATA